jgi:hypothetical protein
MSYEVLLYNIPKVSEDGKKVIPVPDSETKSFTEEADAKKYAQEKKDVFDRVALLKVDEEGPKLIERYSDGRHEKAEDIVRR